MFRPLFRGLTRPLFVEGFGSRDQCERWVYNFDGVNDFAQFAERLIDLDSGAFSVKWHQMEAVMPPFGAANIFVQADFDEPFDSREFYIRWARFLGDFTLEVMHGGINTSIADAFRPSARYEVAYGAGSLVVLRDDVVIYNQARTIGPARNATLPVFGGAQGIYYNIRINGHLYPINNPTSNIQRSIPDNGNPLTLFNTNQGRWSKIPC